MKQLSTLAIAAAMTTTTAFAGGVVPAPAPPVIVPVVQQAYDWSGFYAGGMVATSSGTMDFSTVPGTEFDVSGEGFGFFAGYNFQTGNLVYGGEVSYLDNAGVIDGFPQEEYINVFDLRARVGYALDRVLLNGFVGYSMATAEQGGPAFRPNWDMSGVVYGVGADVAITDSIFAGLTVERRMWEGDTSVSVAGLGTQSYDPTTLTLRVGFNF